VTLSITIIAEGATEKAFERTLRNFLKERLPGQMPKLRFISKDGRIPKGDLLRRDVERHLQTCDAVIALTDVYTGNQPPEFANAADAKAKMHQWVGAESRFHPHAAQYEFEAWLLPFWPRTQKLSGSNRQSPSRNPETVNHDKPPSRHLEVAYLTGKKRAYRKTLDSIAILRDQDLAVAAAACPELKAFQNTLLSLAGGATI